MTAAEQFNQACAIKFASHCLLIDIDEALAEAAEPATP